MASIIELNEDCLNCIFKQFTIYELIDIENVCIAFKTTCEIVYKSKKFHKFRIELRYLRSEYLSLIFERIGSTLREFEFSGGGNMDKAIKENVINGLTMYGERLQKLTLNYFEFYAESFELLKNCFHTLTYLDLSRCQINELQTKISIDGEKFKNIKTLKLAGNTSMSGYFFKNMKYLEILDVSFCYELRYFEFVQFLKNCENLIELDATASCQLIPEDQDILEELAYYQPNLEKIVMENTGMQPNYDALRKFKKLKYSNFSGRRFGT